MVSGPIGTDKFRPTEVKATGVMARKSVHEPLQTGIKAIDAARCQRTWSTS